MRVIALGAPDRGDDAAALVLAPRLPFPVDALGRPGLGLLERLEIPVLLLDAVRSGRPPGTLVEVPLGALRPRAPPHRIGPAEVLALAAALGRPARGWLVGVKGARFDPGAGLSGPVAAAMDAWWAAVVRRARAMQGEPGDRR